MSKDVKRTYSRKDGTRKEDSAFDEARKPSHIRQKPIGKFPNGVPYALSPKSKIWCKIGPHSPNKNKTNSPDVKLEGKNRKRKLQYNVGDELSVTRDPFGFNDLEDDVDILQREFDEALESPKKKISKTYQKAKEKPLSKQRSPKSPNKKQSPNKSATSPKAKGRQKMESARQTKQSKTGTKSPSKQTNKRNKTNSKAKVVKKQSPDKKSRNSNVPKKSSKQPHAKKSLNLPKEASKIEKCEEEEDDKDKSIEESPDEDDEESDNDLDLARPLSTGLEDASPPLAIFSTKKAIIPARQRSKNPKSVRVPRQEKKLFTIVKNTKQANDCFESGESQLFLDDVSFLLDGMQATCSTKMRCLSAIELASKCAGSSFRLGLRAHGYIDKIFLALQDATSDAGLALCTASIMFMLTRDRLNIDFDKTILDLLLRLLLVKAETDGKSKIKEINKVKTRIRTIFHKSNIKGIETLNLSNLTASVLAQQSLLSISSQRTGEWFKDEIRLLGGLDHILDTVLELTNYFKPKDFIEIPADFETIMQVERCLKLLENVTFKSGQNQSFLLSLKDGAIIDICIRLLNRCRALLSTSEADSKSTYQECLLTTLRLLLNLTHDNEQGCTKLCHLDSALETVLHTALQTSEVITEDKKFDTIVLSLGLLINIVEHNTQNLCLLNTAAAPPYHECSENSEMMDEDEFTIIHALMQLFLVKAEATKSTSILTENLPDLNTTISHNTTLRLGPDGLSIYCEEKPNEEEDESNRKNIPQKPRKRGKPDKKDIGEAIQKAGQHMEDSFVASYAALLLGLLSHRNEVNRETIHRLLPNGDFTIMVETLTEFLNFTTMTGAAKWSGIEAIKQVLSVFKECQETYRKQQIEDVV